MGDKNLIFEIDNFVSSETCDIILNWFKNEKREWWMVEIEDYEELKRPESQGGIWYISKRIKPIKKC